MGSKGWAYDNGVAESFLRPSRRSSCIGASWPTRRELISEVFEFVEGFDNTTRRHSTLGYLSPAQFETMTTIKINKENGSQRKPRSVRRTGFFVDLGPDGQIVATVDCSADERTEVMA
jgi:hypothetical protein